eukprot:CAMPEP_0113524778 /NCGR_PEP_ID=MMETSP0014_2-20120614/46392_1 /TAXON_ID=2857 /ORGANISM="Nitzschia sp." /LENGTH=761 /DNA_ID=CAMNT_0000422901 /DNA_START=164 /DNA_END=2445 /DNA_ORIENTATION=+ /assembly_acc=CAM_ASM_000159
MIMMALLHLLLPCRRESSSSFSSSIIIDTTVVTVATRLVVTLLLATCLLFHADSGNTKTTTQVAAWVPPPPPPQSQSRSRSWSKFTRRHPAADCDGSSSIIIIRPWRKITTITTSITTTTTSSKTSLSATTETKEAPPPASPQTPRPTDVSSSSSSPPRFHPTFQDLPVGVDEALSTSEVPSVETEKALSSLAATFLALLVGDEDAATSLSKDKHHKKSLIHDVFQAYDVCDSGTLSREEARRLFVDLARNIVTDLATPSDDREEPCVSESNNKSSNNNSQEGGGDSSNSSSSNSNNNDTIHRVDTVIDDEVHGTKATVFGLTSFRPTSNKTVVPAAARANAQRVLRGEEEENVENDGNESTGHRKRRSDDSIDITFDGKDRQEKMNNKNSNTIERIASKLLLMADTDMDGRVSLIDLATLFETIYGATTTTDSTVTDDDDDDDKTSKNKKKGVKTFPQPLMALAGSLQLVPAVAGGRRDVTDAALPPDAKWNIGVPGDDHTLRRVVIDEGKLSIVGIGRSADASSYFLPELGIVLDAGLNVKSLRPRTVLLSHGHRDHISALPVHAASKAKIFCPRPIESLVERFLLAEAQLNYGDVSQTDEETIAALGAYDINGVTDGDQVLLPRDAYQGSPTPIGVEVFNAPHKEGIPAVSYGLYRVKNRLKAEYSSLPKAEIGKLIRQDKDVQLTEPYHEGVLFYTGDTTIRLLKERWEDILTKYSYVIHEVTFLGRPSTELDATSAAKGHTHYAQLHPWICAFQET